MSAGTFKAKVGCQIPINGITGSCELWVLEQNLGPLQEQQELNCSPQAHISSLWYIRTKLELGILQIPCEIPFEIEAAQYPTLTDMSVAPPSATHRPSQNQWQFPSN